MLDNEADDLNAGTEADTETGAEDTEGKAPAQTETLASPKDGKDADAQDDKGGKSPKTIASGDDTETEDKAKAEANAKAHAEKVNPRELTAELRKLIATHYAAGDKKAEAKELKRLDRIKDIPSLWGMFRELESKFTSGDIVKKPGKDAKPEDIAEFRKALGVPEKPEDYLKDVKLDNGAIIGDADKPVVSTFAAAMHKAGAPPPVMNAALNWYYQRQEEIAAAQDEADEAHRRESEAKLKEELGPSFKRQTNAISTLFATAPGGADAKNPNSLYSRLVGGRTADGKLIGNDPEVMRWLIGMVGEVNPIASVVEDGANSVKSVEKELEELQALRKTDKRKYFSDAVQAREAELIAAREKFQARQRA